MDTKSEDTIVKQIEKNLSNNMNESLFLSGRVYESNKPMVKGFRTEKPEETLDKENEYEDYPLVSNENIINSPTISRAEYIRQAREACLRQLSESQVYSRPYDVNYMDSETQTVEQMNNKKAKLINLYTNEEEAAVKEENTPQEIAAYRSLIIRSVCAIVLFLSVFIIDKFEIKIGDFTHSVIQEYVTGNDSLEDLEDIFVAWFK